MRRLLLAAGLLLSCAAVAGPRPGMLPPDVAGQFPERFLEGYGEPPLWPPEARRGYRSRHRLTITGILLTSASIRIDEREDGGISGSMAFVDRRDRQSPHRRTETRFPVSRAQLDGLRRAIEAAPLFRFNPEFWRMTDPESICIDGMEMIFERADASGYNFSTANAQCTATDGVRRVALLFFEIARAPRLNHWVG